MITFSDIKTLAEQLGYLEVSNTKEVNSAVNCIKIEQLESKVTKFTTYEPKVGVYERRVLEHDPNCFGDIGDVYLVDAVEFIKKVTVLSKTNCKYLTIFEEEGMLACIDNYHATLNEVNFTDKDYLALYNGDYSEFTPPVLDNFTQIGYAPAQSFKNLVKVITEVGQYTDTNETYLASVNGSGRTVLLDVDSSKFTLFSTSKNKSVWFTYTQPASFTKPRVLVLEGRHFNRLKSFSVIDESIEIFSCIYTESTTEDEEVIEGTKQEWILFMSKYHSTAFRIMEFEGVEIKRYYSQFTNFESSVEFSTREVNQFTLQNAFTRLKEKSNKTQLEILFLEDDENEPYFKIKDAKSFLSTREFRLPIFYSDTKDYLPIVFTIDNLEGIFNILRVSNEIRKQSIDSTSNFSHISLELGNYIRTYNSKEIISFIMFIKSSGDSGDSSEEVKILAQPRDGYEYIVNIAESEYDKIMEEK